MDVCIKYVRTCCFYDFVFFYLKGGPLPAGSATTYAKHKCLHPPRTKNEQASQPKSKPYSTTAAQAKTRKPWGVTRETTQAASQNENERTNRPDTQNRSPTLPRQLRPRPKKATAKQRETEQATSANANEQEQTRTNKRQQSPVERRAPRSRALPRPSNQRLQGTRQRPATWQRAR